ncbi:MAG: TIGR01459 family HAD-type hydrolase [Hyphomicrobiaceae bacterium]|nr:TIGR01459 family HAD-type hydrolase [Hyphomicrobiaceae bacterium]
MPPRPEIIENCTALLEQYDVLFCDVWGVVHDGKRAFEGANEALSTFRGRGGTVVLVSNAPTPSSNVARVLDEKGVVREAWDAIVSSGDLALAHVRREGWQSIHHIGPTKRDRAFFEALGAPSVAIEAAEGITVTGLADDRRETPEHYRARLEMAVERGLTLVCANPDLVVHVGADLLPCAGALGALYEEMGGDVHWAGKPFPIAYETALVEAARLRGAAVPRTRVLAIGDSIRTDLAAAAGAGIDALFITSGIHRDETMEDGRVSQRGLDKLLGEDGPGALAAAVALRL